jgi:hypothetical protein
MPYQIRRFRSVRSSRPPGSQLMAISPLFLLLIFLMPSSSTAKEKSTPARRARKVRQLVDDQRGKLQITGNIQVSIVPENKRMVSVERLSGVESLFLMSFDQGFLDTLDDEELSAAIAHELGHVWIFLHHPYLQTEALANEIAMGVVTRESLTKIYAKLWLHLGTAGDLDDFLGPQKRAASH